MLRIPKKLSGPPRDLTSETQMRQYWIGAIVKQGGQWFQCVSTVWWPQLRRASQVLFSSDPSGADRFPTLPFTMGTMDNVAVRERLMGPIILRAVGGVFRCEPGPTLGGVRITGLVRQGNRLAHVNYPARHSSAGAQRSRLD